MKHITAITIALSVALGSSAFGQDNGRQNERRQRPAPFQQFFSLPGVEFSNEQQSKVEELRKKFVPKLTEHQKNWDAVITQEQQQVRREALRKARDAGKDRREAAAAVDAAIEIVPLSPLFEFVYFVTQPSDFVP